MNIEPQELRLGHALGERGQRADLESVRLVIELVIGSKKLEPRKPDASNCVERAEEILGADPRPIYAFVGDLHPELGSVGVVISRRWAQRGTQGVSACDSGGLAGRFGYFVELPDEAAAAEALRSLSSPDGLDVKSWEQAFADEIEASYDAGAGGYVCGDEPEVLAWTDARRRCIEAARGGSGKPDRRLWTWELRLEQPPRPDEIEALVVSPEAAKVVRSERRKRGGLPDTIRIVRPEKPDGELDEWFRMPEVWAALSGRTTWLD